MLSYKKHKGEPFMKPMIRRLILFLFTLLLPICLFSCGDGLAQYDASEDAPFLPKDINKYFEGYILNEFGVPTITVEHTTNAKMPPAYSSECMTVAVETYANFIVQNALFYLQ